MKGWKEIKYEVVRDCQDNCIMVYNMEVSSLSQGVNDYNHVFRTLILWVFTLESQLSLLLCRCSQTSTITCWGWRWSMSSIILEWLEVQYPVHIEPNFQRVLYHWGTPQLSCICLALIHIHVRSMPISPALLHSHWKQQVTPLPSLLPNSGWASCSTRSKTQLWRKLQHASSHLSTTVLSRFCAGTWKSSCMSANCWAAPWIWGMNLHDLKMLLINNDSQSFPLLPLVVCLILTLQYSTFMCWRHFILPIFIYCLSLKWCIIILKLTYLWLTCSSVHSFPSPCPQTCTYSVYSPWVPVRDWALLKGKEVWDKGMKVQDERTEVWDRRTGVQMPELLMMGIDLEGWWNVTVDDKDNILGRRSQAEGADSGGEVNRGTRELSNRAMCYILSLLYDILLTY